MSFREIDLAIRCKLSEKDAFKQSSGSPFSVVLELLKTAIEFDKEDPQARKAILVDNPEAEIRVDSHCVFSAVDPAGTVFVYNVLEKGKWPQYLGPIAGVPIYTTMKAIPRTQFEAIYKIFS